jgi:hypothetical protein
MLSVYYSLSIYYIPFVITGFYSIYSFSCLNICCCIIVVVSLCWNMDLLVLFGSIIVLFMIIIIITFLLFTFLFFYFIRSVYLFSLYFIHLTFYVEIVLVLVYWLIERILRFNNVELMG